MQNTFTAIDFETAQGYRWSICQEHRIPLNHHDALSDALACAELYKSYLSNL